jgi:hypothetical protein
MTIGQTIAAFYAVMLIVFLVLVYKATEGE